MCTCMFLSGCFSFHACLKSRRRLDIAVRYMNFAPLTGPSSTVWMIARSLVTAKGSPIVFVQACSLLWALTHRRYFRIAVGGCLAYGTKNSVRVSIECHAMFLDLVTLGPSSGEAHCPLSTLHVYFAHSLVRWTTLQAGSKQPPTPLPKKPSVHTFRSCLCHLCNSIYTVHTPAGPGLKKKLSTTDLPSHPSSPTACALRAPSRCHR